MILDIHTHVDTRTTCDFCTRKVEETDAMFLAPELSVDRPVTGEWAQACVACIPALREGGWS